jgi:hypothetical protein
LELVLCPYVVLWRLYYRLLLFATVILLSIFELQGFKQMQNKM